MRYYSAIFAILFYTRGCLGDENAKSYKCEIAAFIEDDIGTKPMLIDYGTLKTRLPTCEEDDQKKCAEMAVLQVQAGTHNGNFSLDVDDKNGYTVGDMLCDKADAVEENVRMKTIRVYYRLCGGPWTKTIYTMPEKLCCEDGLYVPCSVYLKN